MSAEISEVENSKDEIYQLMFVASQCTCAFIRIVYSSFQKEKSHLNSITNNTINNMSMDKMEEAISHGKRVRRAMNNMSSYFNTISTAFSEYHQKCNTKQIQSVNTTKKDAKKALKCLILGY
eukprot:99029_1